MGKSIRILVVDDSPLIREMISDSIRAQPDFELAGTAADGKQALAVFDRACPDVVTLDIEMPRMNGLEALDAMLARRPVPIIMVSAQTRLGADATLEALQRGALDYVAKPEDAGAAAAALGGDLMRRIRAVAGADVRRVMELRQRRKLRRAALRREIDAGTGVQPAAAAVDSTMLNLTDKCVVLGISTGGPPALCGMFEALHGPLPPMVVVQHMPQHFTRLFAARLNELSRLEVKEAETGDILRPNWAYVAPGGKHLAIERRQRGGRLLVSGGAAVSGHKPSVDVTMKSAAAVYRDRVLGVIMTGMGRDGVDGCAAIRAAGGYVLGQDEASSDVYGMNKAAFSEGHVDRQFGLDEAAGVVALQVKRMWVAAAAAAQ